MHPLTHSAVRIRVALASLAFGSMSLFCSALAEEKPVIFTDATPQEFYRIVHRAKWQVDSATVLACTSRRVRTDEAQVYETLMRERSRLPEDLVLRGREVSARVATLIFEGRRKDRDTGRITVSEGTVTLVQEDGMWRIRHEQWRDTGFDLPDDAARSQPDSAK